jgi:hypothetical protein
LTEEGKRLEDDARRIQNWKRWGPYLSERQWGTVREDYSATGECWDYFPHDQARSRAYRWGEDGLLGITDRECRLCFALALWNGRDPILKERLFGLGGTEGNHGEDCKECYYYLDSTPTHSYMKALYKYPQRDYPYAQLIAENRRRTRDDPEYELIDTGVFDDGRYFDVFAEYAKAGTDDILIRITVGNRGRDAARLHVLPTLWFRNTWSWGRSGDGYPARPSLAATNTATVLVEHETLGRYRFEYDTNGLANVELLFTENESNFERLWGVSSASPFVKDAFHRYLIDGQKEAVNPARMGTKVAACVELNIPGDSEVELRLRLRPEEGARGKPFGKSFETIFAQRKREADEFFASRTPAAATAEERLVLRQGYAGLLWTKQFYHYVVREWLEGDPAQPIPPIGRLLGRNHDWPHLYNRDVLSMPDKWEYPWYAAWDLAFHMIPFAHIDPHFTKEQLVLFLREWYMHPNGQIPAYEFALGDVNPPVHAWACWRAYKLTGPRGQRDRLFLERTFQKLLINFTWWVNRKDNEGNNLFAGGFLGLDNIGVFDRSKPLPTGGSLEQADGTAWMAFYCTTMLSMALELADGDPAYEDLASKFFEHFVAISDAINTFGGSGLWDEKDGFYYDELHVGDDEIPLRIRSMVGIIPLFACELLEQEVMDKLPNFTKRTKWFLKNRSDLKNYSAYMERDDDGVHTHRLLALPSRERLLRVLAYLLDEKEFLSPHGIRSLSRVHLDNPYIFDERMEEHRVHYTPGESDTGVFGGNSNWRGPIWLPVNYLLIESLERYYHFYGDTLRVECPTGSGKLMNLLEVALELAARLSRLFLPDAEGHRPCHGGDRRYAEDPHWRDLVLFYEYFHGDSGRGVGASHQTGWTSLIVRCIQDLAKVRSVSAATDGRITARVLRPSAAWSKDALLGEPER